uniref:Uncharacterized protein n=1 Tax=Arion vulgaris TaxID=1028688 RepID=A0A0B6ZAA5_9EUPU
MSGTVVFQPQQLHLADFTPFVSILLLGPGFVSLVSYPFKSCPQGSRRLIGEFSYV